MSKRSERKRRRRLGLSQDLSGRGDGSPIETRCQARGLVTTDRPKRRSKNACRRKGRQGNPRNQEW
jgi:hypothetical protein